jgi:hypothetical protein
MQSSENNERSRDFRSRIRALEASVLVSENNADMLMLLFVLCVSDAA